MNFNTTGTTANRVGSRTLETGTLREDHESTASENRTAKKAFLNVIRSRADIGNNAFLVGRTVIGRNASCDFPVHDPRVSGVHASITPGGEGEFILEDLNSTNGTRIDGTEVFGPTPLHDGDKIFIGETVLRFSFADKLEIDFHSEVATLVGKDPLTDLPSKRRFDDALEFAIQDAARSDSPLAVLMMDMDGVKQINDTHGHLYGAHVIGETGRLIAEVLGSKGQACRFGGDEFSAFLPNQDLASACAVAQQIRKTVETAGFQKDNISLRPTISIGVSCYPNNAAEALTLITTADAALYRAKAQGKNCVAT